jgi:hypothetical protein
MKRATRRDGDGAVWMLRSWVAVGTSAEPERGSIVPMGQERTKEQLYREAKRLGIKGRSKMNKGQLKAAISRRGR